jgi:hypothetical protein
MSFFKYYTSRFFIRSKIFFFFPFFLNKINLFSVTIKKKNVIKTQKMILKGGDGLREKGTGCETNP